MRSTKYDWDLLCSISRCTKQALYKLIGKPGSKLTLTEAVFDGKLAEIDIPQETVDYTLDIWKPEDCKRTNFSAKLGKFTLSGHIRHQLEPKPNLIIRHITDKPISRPWSDQWDSNASVGLGLYLLSKSICEPARHARVEAVRLLGPLGDDSSTCGKHGTVFGECKSLHLERVSLEVEKSDKEMQDWEQSVLHMLNSFDGKRRKYKTPGNAPREGEFNGACARCDYFKECQHQS